MQTDNASSLDISTCAHQPDTNCGELENGNTLPSSSGTSSSPAAPLPVEAKLPARMPSEVPSLIARIDRMLRSFGQIDHRLVATRTIPARTAGWASWPDWIPQRLKWAFQELGFSQLWKHQLEAITAIQDHRPTLIATGTSSGKSLAAWLPFLVSFCNYLNPSANHRSGFLSRPAALYLAPTKALSRDQRHAVQSWIKKAGLPVKLSEVDGDSETETKRWARSADVVFTNPDFLHYAVMSRLNHWSSFLGRLDTIIVDELHSYRGVSGAHFALLLRRLLRVANNGGKQPRLVFLSATTGDPAGHIQALLPAGYKPVVVDTDTCARGSRTIYLWQPALKTTPQDDSEKPESTEGQQPRVSVLTEGAFLSAQLLGLGASLITFAHSRSGVETVSNLVQEQLVKYFPQQLGRFAAYRGGYLPEERRALEAGLRTGELLGLASTSALELGIDFSGLDVTVTCGWPGTKASFWQQAGRAGRRNTAGVSILIASDNPLDSYLLHHPDEIFKPVEKVVFDTSNIYLLVPHLLCAAAEAPLTERDLFYFGLDDTELLERLADQKLLIKRPKGWFWNITQGDMPWEQIALRPGGSQVQIVEANLGTVIGTVDQDRADRVLFPNAIYLHQGKSWQVVQADSQVALVRPGPVNLRTRANSSTKIKILKVFNHLASTGNTPGIDWYFGQVEVTDQVTSYDLLRQPNNQFQGHFPLRSPERKLVTNAVWYTLSEQLVKHLLLDKPTLLAGSLHAAEHASIGMLPLLAVCDRWDLGGVSIDRHPETGLPTVFVYDGVPGGAGFAEHGFHHYQQWIYATYQQVKDCVCAEGCPRCIQSPKCGNTNQYLSKPGALTLLHALLNQVQ